MSNKSQDSSGYSWQTYDSNGNKVQENSKTWSGEHKWYNQKTGYQGYHGENVTPEQKSEAGKWFKSQQKK